MTNAAKPAASLLFVSFSLNYPITVQRLSTFRRLCDSVTAVGFVQNFGHVISGKLPASNKFDPNTLVLGTISSGRYIARLFAILSAIPTVRRAAKTADAIYAVDFDGALLTRIALIGIPPPVIAYEVHDIRSAFMRPDAIGHFLRFIERWVTKQVTLIVSTAHGYVSGYYESILGMSFASAFVLENKTWPTQQCAPALPWTPSRALRLGYFGMLRCRKAWNALLALDDAMNARVEIIIRGVPIDIPTFTEDLKAHPRIRYLGPYADPDDVATIHENVDIIWAAGFHQKSSYVWARSCRFYNALSCGTPIIAQSGSDEGIEVALLDVGAIVDLENIPNTVDTIRSITPTLLRHWRARIRLLDPSVYSHTDDHTQLCQRIEYLIDQRQISSGSV